MTWQPLLLIQYVGTTTLVAIGTIQYTVQHIYFITKTIDIVFIKILHVSVQPFISRLITKRSDVLHYNKGELTHRTVLVPCTDRAQTVSCHYKTTLYHSHLNCSGVAHGYNDG